MIDLTKDLEVVFSNGESTPVTLKTDGSDDLILVERPFGIFYVFDFDGKCVTNLCIKTFTNMILRNSNQMKRYTIGGEIIMAENKEKAGIAAFGRMPVKKIANLLEQLLEEVK